MALVYGKYHLYGQADGLEHGVSTNTISAQLFKIPTKICSRYFHPCIWLITLQITFASSLDPDQDWQIVGPEQDPKPFHTLIVFLK